MAEGGESFLLTKEQSDKVSKARADASKRNDVLKVLMSSAMCFAPALLGLRWSLFSAPSRRSFVVGDCPFAIVPPRSHSTDLEGVGPMTPGAATFVPLSSTLCLRLTNSEDTTDRRRTTEAAGVRAINDCQVMNSECYLFGADETLLLRLTEALRPPCLNPAVVVTREAASVSDPRSGLLHTFTESKIPSEWADRVPSD